MRNGETREIVKIPEWLQEFRENLVDDEIPEHGAETLTPVLLMKCL